MFRRGLRCFGNWSLAEHPCDHHAQELIVQIMLSQVAELFAKASSWTVGNWANTTVVECLSNFWLGSLQNGLESDS